ncbi:MAG: cupin domain-containing protein [Candidatus Leucobacter sulfamidivorax]|nr:cupin domain-containing protein [Candidatus Leucobacter sulfamidivorax]
MAEYNPFSTDVEPGPETTRVRRLVTDVDETGRAYIATDELCSHRVTGHGCPSYVTTNLWRTDESPANNRGELVDPYDTDQPLSVGPTPNGSVFRTLELPPDTEWRFDDEGNEVKPLAFHTTASVDYAIVLRGEIWALIDDDEALMKQGDVLIQRGTRHAWSNRSNESCLLAFVLVGGNLPELPGDTA